LAFDQPCPIKNRYSFRWFSFHFVFAGTFAKKYMNFAKSDKPPIWELCSLYAPDQNYFENLYP